MQVHWRKGLENFQSFFRLLAEARDEVGNSALPNWCFDVLGIGFSRVTQIAKCLKEDDQLRVKQELAQARQAEREQKAAKRQERERQRQEELAKRQQQRKERQEAQRREKHRKAERKYRRRKREREQTRTPAVVTGPFTFISESELVSRIKAAQTRLQNAKSEWIEASLELATLLVQVRQNYAADREFGGWLDVNNINISQQDRAALIHLGQDIKAMRNILEQTERRSFRYIWEDVKLQLQ